MAYAISYHHWLDPRDDYLLLRLGCRYDTVTNDLPDQECLLDDQYAHGGSDKLTILESSFRGSSA